MKKYRLNKDKLFRNFIVLSNVITIGLVIHKIATCGISYISTIGYLDRKEGQVMDIFEEIMALIEQKGNIPFMMKDVEKWRKESERNEALLKIYKLASIVREMED